MRKAGTILIGMVLAIALVVPVSAADDVAKKLNEVLMKGPAEGHWQVKADDVDAWIKAKKTDFLVVDVRPNPPGQQGGRIPGSIYIPYNEILKPENLKKLPKDKKLILVCVTGQTQNLPVVALRVLGYDARTMSFGHAAWIKDYLGAQLMQQAIQNAA
ncbi:MAG TPA: rhodanese-like domain-containing protein, partial [Thermodesulfovibrionales bacterium]|nr:rhodanese-like domain-containing protein [Thermodesulfovibrionales bacterium]